MKVILLIAFVMLSAASSAVSQSAYHNKYVQVLETKDCNDTIIVANLQGVPSGPVWLSAGDRVLIIQMKGGDVKYYGDHFVTPNKASGPVRYDNGAGHFEFATVAAVEAINGTNPQQYRVLLENPLKNLYEATLWGGEPNGVQLVRIPTDPTNATAPFLYDDITISSSISVPDWNGTTGGVYVLEITGTLTLTANVDANGAGYAGGASSAATTSWRSRRDKVYDRNNNRGGEKGEGIDIIADDWNTGRGAAGNGGGGGNAEGAGGGGGSNYGAGGMGGMQRTETNSKDIKNGGEGGYPFHYKELGVRAVMGAGGGAGHAGLSTITLPLRTPTSGARGGGIIIIRAEKMIANGGDLLANGADASMSYDAGAGGGGAGGTVLLAVGSYADGPGTTDIQVKGGGGGYAQEVGVLTGANAYSSIYCFGPGGGGGGGLIWVSTAQPPSNTIVAIATTGGSAGAISVNPATVSLSGCTVNGHREAQNGVIGAVLTNLVLPGDPLP